MIDMDDLIGDGDFFQDLTVWRRGVTYDVNGRAREVGSYVTGLTGSIQSGANPELMRAPDMSTVLDVITIYTGASLYVEGDTFGNDPDPAGSVTTDRYGNAVVPDGTVQFKSDIIMHRGDPYEVFLVQDWSDYGAGFIEAVAKKISRTQVAM